MTILLDTNVISETTRLVPDANVLRFLGSLDRAFVSVLTIHELHFGISRLPPGQRRADLTASIDRFLVVYEDSVIDVDRRIARRAGELRSNAEAKGRVLRLADALIAATAQERSLTLATRNVNDFAGHGLTIVNPWQPSTP